MADEVTLSREEVETLTGYISAQNPGEPNDTQRAVLAKLEAVVTTPPSDSYVGGDANGK